MNEPALAPLLKQLRLPTILKYYESFAKEATQSNQTYEQYLGALAQEEAINREKNRIKNLLNKAKFPFQKTMDDFQFDQIPSLNKQQILQLADCSYIQKIHNVCLLGQTGTGKTHLAIALGRLACQAGYSTLFFSAAHLVNALIEARNQMRLSRLQTKLLKANLVIVDELGYLPLSKEGAQLLFQFFADRYEKGSILVTSNLQFSEWTQFLNDPTMTSALLDRLTHHATICTLTGESFRFKQRMKKEKNVKNS